MEIAPGIRRLGTGKVNVYLIEVAGGLAEALQLVRNNLSG